VTAISPPCERKNRWHVITLEQGSQEFIITVILFKLE
jgi:hypothetical protein